MAAVAEVAEVAAAEAARDAYWRKHREIRDDRSRDRDGLLTGLALIAAEELEIAKAARDAR